MAEKATSKFIYALGRRKTSVATVRLFEIKGESQINAKPVEKYLPSKYMAVQIDRVFEAAGMDKSNFHFTSKTSGGGVSSQVGAVVLGLARAIVKSNPETKKALKDKGLLTRDSRMVERKKTGLHKARKREQYSKR